MSLINDMLRDLAQRQEPVPVDDNSHLLETTGLTRKRKPAWLPSAIAFLVTVTLLWIVQQQFFNATPVPVSTGEVAVITAEQPIEQQEGSAAFTDRDLIETPISASEIVDNGIDSAAEASGVRPEESPATVTASVQITDTTGFDKPEDLHQPVIEAWLRLAQQAVLQDRLTTPLEQSAYYFYLQVLGLVPDHPQALRGMEIIAERYVALARAAQMQQQPERAYALLQRAQVVMPDSPVINEALQQLAENVADRNPPIAMRASAMTDHTRGTDPNAAVVESVDAASRAHSLPMQEEVSRAPLLQVTPNREWLDQQMTEQALDWMQQGQVQHAQRQLEMFLMEGEGTQASQLLYQIYLEQNDFHAAAELLAQADTHGWSSLDQARLQAQGLLARQDPAAAVAVLESYLTEAQHDERYRVLLASLYRTTGRYHEAAASYRRLLDSFGEAGSYWLGLALSLDALGEKHSALEAFQRAKNFQPLQAEVNLYIEQRIAALKR